MGAEFVMQKKYFENYNRKICIFSKDKMQKTGKFCQMKFFALLPHMPLDEDQKYIKESEQIVIWVSTICLVVFKNKHCSYSLFCLQTNSLFLVSD